MWLAASLLYRGDDQRRLVRLHRLAATARVPLLATNEVLYHDPARRPLQDVLTCIREKTTIDAIGKRLEANAERYLKPAHEMARLFRDVPEAIAETMNRAVVADRKQVEFARDLDGALAQFLLARGANRVRSTAAQKVSTGWRLP